MKRMFLALSLALWAAIAVATPLQFFSASYSTDALAIAGAVLDQHSDASPASPLPLLTAASATSGADSASSAGVADTGFLGTYAEATSDVENSGSLASASFRGTFIGTGAPIGLNLFYESSGSGSAASHLLVTFNLLNLFDDVIGGSGSFETLLDLAAGIDGILEILLTSSADANAGTSAYHVATVQYTASVPETPTLALLFAGIAAMGALRRSARRKAAVAGR